MDRVATVSSERSRAVKLSLDQDRLILSVNAPDAGAAEEELIVAYADDPLEIGFNAKFLKEMLSTLDGDQVQLRLSAPNRAGLVIPNENERDEDITMLIMPMMLNNY